MSKSSKHPLNMYNEISIAIIANLIENTRFRKLFFCEIIVRYKQLYKILKPLIFDRILNRNGENRNQKINQRYFSAFLVI